MNTAVAACVIRPLDDKIQVTWAEDRATVGTDPSAVPGAKTEGRAENRLACSACSSYPLRDWHNAINPSRQQP